MEGRELRRSYTQVEFPLRSRQDYNRTSSHQVRNKKMPAANAKKTPTMEIYRPPGQRQEDIIVSKLNVNAKEFAPSSCLQTSKSAGNVLLAGQHKMNTYYPLQPSKSVTFNGANVRAQVKHEPVGDRNNNKLEKKELQRSKSMIYTQGAYLKHENSIRNLPELAPFLQKTDRDPNAMPSSELIDLASKIVSKACDNRKYAEVLASACATLVEKEAGRTFLESLINACQYVIIRPSLDPNSKNTKVYYPFMAFVSHLYSLLKRLPLEESGSWLGLAPSTILLHVLVQCCQGLLKEPLLKHKQEVECLFFVVTTVGRDLENQIPKQLESLVASIREAFVREGTPMDIRKTLMQLIELKASKWQLPAYTVLYYQKPIL